MENITGNFENTTSTSSLENNFNVIPPGTFDFLVKFIYAGLLPLTIIIGLFGNLLTFVVFCRINKKWNSATINLFSLALADFFNLLTNSLVVVKENLRIYVPASGNYLHKLFVPYFQTWLPFIFSRFSMIFTIFIAAERVLAILVPLKSRYICSKKISILSSILLMAFLTTWFLPYAFYFELVYTLNNKTGEYVPQLQKTDFSKHPYFWNLYGNLQITCFQIIPVLITIILNVMITIGLFLSVRRRKKLTAGSSNSQRNEFNTKEIRITKTILTVTVVFTICMIPGAIIHLLILADPESKYYDFRTNLHRFFALLEYELYMVNSAVNFIIYITTSRTYRMEYRKILNTCFKKTCILRTPSSYNNQTSTSLEARSSTAVAVSIISEDRDIYPNEIDFSNKKIEKL